MFPCHIPIRSSLRFIIRSRIFGFNRHPFPIIHQLSLPFFMALYFLAFSMENSTHGNEGEGHFQDRHVCSFVKQVFLAGSRDMPLRCLPTKFEQNRTKDELYRYSCIQGRHSPNVYTILLRFFFDYSPREFPAFSG
jgi:hypothetical protein